MENAAQRKVFQSDLTGYAGISAALALQYVRPIAALANEFRAGRRGLRDRARADLYRAAAALSRVERRVLEWTLALVQGGARGVVVPQDVACASLEAATGDPISTRHFRRGLRGLQAAGWLAIDYRATGRIVQSSGGFVQLQVTRIVPSANARALVARGPLARPSGAG